jgi:hypothetical protein
MTHSFSLLIVAAVTVASCAGATATVARNQQFAPEAPAAVASRYVGITAGDPLRVSVYPSVITAHGDAWVHVRVEANASSRAVDLEWFSPDAGGGSHLISLDGDRAAVHHQFALKRLEAGEYEIRAVLLLADGSRMVRSATLLVSGMR